MSDLPAGLRAAPLAPSDAAEVTRVWRACELHDDGESLFTEADFVAAWQRPRDVHRVIEDAFGEWPDHLATTFEDWAAETLGRPGFTPEQIALFTQYAKPL